MSQPKNIKMGIDNEVMNKTTFVRKFRWTLNSNDGLPQHWNKKIKVDFGKKIIKLQIYDVINDFILDDWISNINSKTELILETYDGCGSCLYKYTFKSIDLISDKIGFDYSSSDISCRNLKFKYVRMEKQNYQGESVKNVDIKNLEQIDKISFKNDEKTTEFFNCKLKNTPNLLIEEVKINHLNATTLIPGKAIWKPLKVKMKRSDFFKLIDRRTANLGTFVINRYLGNSLLETWTLIDAIMDKEVESDLDEVQFKLKFSNVKYEQSKNSVEVK